MAKSFPEVDVVIVGMGWCGGILAKELAESGMKVVGLERGATRTVENDFSVPHIRDELEYHARTGLAQNLKKETWTVRNGISETALPMRKYGSFIPGDGLGGSGVHWNGQTWRWTDMEFKIKSNYVERYGKKFIPEDMTIQDWGITYAELEPYYDHFEKIAAVSGVAGNLNGQIKNEGTG
jgi:gluconate 2-dehydrogenase alpha chain